MNRTRDGDQIGAIKVPLQVVLGEKEIRLEELSRIGEGTIIAFNSLAGEPVALVASGEQIAWGEVIVYDFKRPDKFSKDQIRTISIMHETFARLMTTMLSATLRMFTQAHVTLVDQMTFQEFIDSIPNPTTLAIIDMQPLRGSAILRIDPAITFAVIDRLFGGQGNWGKFSRDLSDIEQSIMEGIIVRILGNLQESWSTVIDLKPALGGIETNPMFAQIVPPTEMVVLVTLEVKVGEGKGMINLCIPYLTIEPLIPKLSAQYWYSMLRRSKEERSTPLWIGDLKVEAELFFEAEPLSLKDLAHLERNSLVKLPHIDQAFLLAGDSPVLRLKQQGANQGTSYEFSVEPDERPQESFQYLVGSPEPGKEEELTKLLEGPINKLRAEVRDGLQSLSSAIESIGNRQDELADQLYFEAQKSPADRSSAAPLSTPFGFIGAGDIDLLYTFIELEHPQTIAMILSYLETELSANLLSGLPEEAQTEVVERIASMDRVAPAVITKVEEVIEARIKCASAGEYTASGSVEAVAGILNISSRSVEKHVIESLEKSNQALAEEIKMRMFVFEDIVLLDNSGSCSAEDHQCDSHAGRIRCNRNHPPG